jgi:hypothetical protein
MTHIKRYREFTEIAAANGVDCARVVFGRRHPRLVGMVGKRKVSLLVPSSAGDGRHGTLNWRAQLRRTVRGTA